MPFPNSNSPLTISLTQKFVNPPGSYGQPPATVEADLLNMAVSLAQVARNYNVISQTDQAAFDHINDWPFGQQRAIRKLLAQAVHQLRPVTFNWEEAPTTWFSLISFGPAGGLGVTFRSPISYPPWGP
jgi:hypothetical protein